MRFGLIFVLAALVGCTPTSTATKDAPAPSSYDVAAPKITEHMAQPAILVFSKTKEWRHNEGIAGADRFFADLSAKVGYGLYTTENGAIFNPEDLARFDVIVFNNMTGDTLSPKQEDAFKSWLQEGGAWIGLHGAGDNSHTDWLWYDRTLIGPEFIGHPAEPQFQSAKVVSLAPQHPIMKGLPPEWQQTDEWYSFDGVPQDYGLTPLIGLDEKSYSPLNEAYGDISDLRMGSTPIEHPIAWVGTSGKGKIAYSAVGHSHTAYDNKVYAQFLSNMFDWAVDDKAKAP